MSNIVGQKPVVIEVAGQPLGVVVPKGDQFRFLAIKLPVFSIDGASFGSIREATRAASDALAEHRPLV